MTGKPMLTKVTISLCFQLFSANFIVLKMKITVQEVTLPATTENTDY